MPGRIPDYSIPEKKAHTVIWFCFDRKFLDNCKPDTFLKIMTLTYTSLRLHVAALLFTFCCFGLDAVAQNLYTAKGYQEEFLKPNYQSIKQKKEKGDSLSADEASYLTDYENYLTNYFQRLSEAEKAKYAVLKEQSGKNAGESPAENYVWRNRDRWSNASFGVFYGASIASTLNADASLTGGLVLLGGGAMLLGPAINPKRYKGITYTAMNALNKGRLLGLALGAGLGLTLTNAQENQGAKFIFPLASAGSIALGEIAFHQQKKRKLTDGQVGLMGHYGWLTPFAGISVCGALNINSSRPYGAAILAGGIAGICIGNKVSQHYDYTNGDVDAITSLSVITGGLGLSAVVLAFENENPNPRLVLVPSAAAILGTVFAQKQVKGIKLTDRQGSTMILASSGAALVSLGVMASAKVSSPTLLVGIPSLGALLAQQLLLSSYRKANQTIGHHNNRPPAARFSFTINPESYFFRNSQTGFSALPSQPQIINPLFKMGLSF